MDDNKLEALVEVAGYTRAGLRRRGGGAALRALLTTAIGVPLLVALVAWAAGNGQDIRFLWVGIAGPLLLGVVAGLQMPGMAGVIVAIVGAILGGLIAGVGAWLGVGTGVLNAGPDAPSGLRETLIYIPALGLLVPCLMGAQIGVGVVIGSGLSAIRAHRR